MKHTKWDFIEPEVTQNHCTDSSFFPICVDKALMPWFAEHILPAEGDFFHLQFW